MTITIEPLTRGYLVTQYRADGSGDAYAELDALGALHRAAGMLGVEPATLYPPAPELTPEQEALIERGDEDAPTAHLKAGEAVS